MKYRPWDHQIVARDFVENTPTRCGMLELEMGGGKSAIAIDLVERADVQRVLIVCPAKVLGVWPAQFEMWAQSEWSVCSPKGSVAKKAQQVHEFVHETGKRVLVVNYDIVWRGPILAQIRAFEPEAIIADESHRAGAFGSKTARAMRDLSMRARLRLLLTGTAAENSPLRWWSQMFMIDPNVLGWQPHAFEQHITVKRTIMVGRRGRHRRVEKVVGYKNLDWLAAKLKPYVITMSEQDFDYSLPDQVHNTIPVELGPKTMRLYHELEKSANSEIEQNGKVFELRDSSVGARMLALCQGWDSSEYPWLMVDASKSDTLRMLLEDAGQHPIVVVAHFRADVAHIVELAEFVGRKGYSIQGGKDETAEWRQDSTGVLAAQIRSASLGIDLTHAHRMIMYGTSWDAEDVAQVKKRIHRPGQEHTCFYTWLVTKDTVEQAMRGTVRQKNRVANETREELRS